MCELLNDYVSKARYPNDLPIEHIGERQAKDAIEAAEKIERHVMEYFNVLFISDENNEESPKTNGVSEPT